MEDIPMKQYVTAVTLLLCLTAFSWVDEAPTHPLPGLTSANAAAQLGMILGSDGPWTMVRRPSPPNDPHTAIHALSETALCSIHSNAAGQVLRITFAVAQAPKGYGERTHAAFAEEVGRAITTAGNLFLELGAHPKLADDMRRTLGLDNPSLREGKIITARPADVDLAYTARMQGSWYILEIQAEKG